MIPLQRDPHFTFRFAEDRAIPRLHLEGAEAGRRVSVAYRATVRQAHPVHPGRREQPSRRLDGTEEAAKTHRRVAGRNRDRRTFAALQGPVSPRTPAAGRTAHKEATLGLVVWDRGDGTGPAGTLP